MFDISKLSTHYCVRYMSDSDADALLAFCLQNDQYYRYYRKQPSRELILHDLHITPPKTPRLSGSSKNAAFAPMGSSERKGRALRWTAPALWKEQNE